MKSPLHFLKAHLIGTVCVFGLMAVVDMTTHGTRSIMFLITEPSLSAKAAIMLGLATLPVGFLARWLLRATGWTDFTSHLAMGFIIGMLGGIANYILMTSHTPDAAPAALRYMAWFTAIGLTYGWCYYASFVQSKLPQ